MVSTILFPQPIAFMMRTLQLTVAALSGGSIDHAALNEYGVQKVEDATLILTAAKDFVMRNLPDVVEGEITRSKHVCTVLLLALKGI